MNKFEKEKERMLGGGGAARGEIPPHARSAFQKQLSPCPLSSAKGGSHKSPQGEAFSGIHLGEQENMQHVFSGL